MAGDEDQTLPSCTHRTLSHPYPKPRAMELLLLESVFKQNNDSNDNSGQNHTVLVLTFYASTCGAENALCNQLRYPQRLGLGPGFGNSASLALSVESRCLQSMAGHIY